MGEARRRGEAPPRPREQLIARSFETYLGAAYGELLPVDQHREVRRAFFAGAQGALSVLARAADTPDELRVCGDVEAELRAFAAAVEAGRA